VRSTFVHAETLVADTQTLWFKPESPVRFEAGQFVELHLPHEPADERGVTREFSLSSSPSEPLLGITTNFVFERGSSFKRTLKNLQPGDEVIMTEPMGDFVLPKDPSIPLLFVAAGLGCAPYASIVKWLRDRNEQRTIQMIYGVSSPTDFIFNDLWHSYPLQLTKMVSSPTKNWQGETGRITIEKLQQLAAPISDKLVYLAGPQSLIEPLYNDLLRADIPRYQLLLDYFPGY
jgi:ferredoxin-NADP reductase